MWRKGPGRRYRFITPREMTHNPRGESLRGRGSGSSSDERVSGDDSPHTSILPSDPQRSKYEGHENRFRRCDFARLFPGGGRGDERQKPGVPMSTSEPSRSRVAIPSAVMSNTTRWPGRKVRRMLPARASSWSSTSRKSESVRMTPVRVPGSKALTTPCTASLGRSRGRSADLGDLSGADAAGADVDAAG